MARKMAIELFISRTQYMHGSKGWELHPDGGGGDGDVSGRHPDRRRLTFGAEHPRAKWGDASSGALTTGSV